MEQPARTTREHLAVSWSVGFRDRRLLGLLLPRAADRGASQVAPVDKLSLVLVAIFAVIFLGERPTLRDWGGIGMVAGGVLLLALKR